MFLRPKIWLTALVVYEILAVILMHCGRICDAMFGISFCDDSVFKYFIVCFAVPALIGLIVMWIMHIIHHNHRRHSLLHRARSAVSDIASNVRDRISENVSTRDLEKVMAAALLVGIRRFISKNPRRRRDFEKILGADFVAYDDEDFDDDDDTRANRRGNARTRRTTTQSQKNTRPKK